MGKLASLKNLPMLEPFFELQAASMKPAARQKRTRRVDRSFKNTSPDVSCGRSIGLSDKFSILLSSELCRGPVNAASVMRGSGPARHLGRAAAALDPKLHAGGHEVSAFLPDGERVHVAFQRDRQA